MRSITKQGNGGFHLSQAHENPPQTPQDAKSRWHSFKGKADARKALLHEQYHLCCYSELSADEEGLDYHIEHVENKSQNPQRTFDYTNLAASALESDQDLRRLKGQVFGGHAVGKQAGVDLALFVSCHQTDCQRFFAYLSDGRVTPALKLSPQDTQKAKYTIDILNLNSPYLIILRQKWWNELEQLFEEHISKGWDLYDLASIDLLPTGQRLSRFFSLTRQFYGNLAENILQKQAPYLK